MSLYASVATAVVTQQTHCFCGDAYGRESLPDGFRAGFTIALASEESAQACDESQHFIELGLRRSTGFREQVREGACARPGP